MMAGVGGQGCRYELKDEPAARISRLLLLQRPLTLTCACRSAVPNPCLNIPPARARQSPFPATPHLLQGSRGPALPRPAFLCEPPPPPPTYQQACPAIHTHAHRRTHTHTQLVRADALSSWSTNQPQACVHAAPAYLWREASCDQHSLGFRI
jgi:hypothetical protein